MTREILMIFVRAAVEMRCPEPRWLKALHRVYHEFEMTQCFLAEKNNVATDDKKNIQSKRSIAYENIRIND